MRKTIRKKKILRFIHAAVEAIVSQGDKYHRRPARSYSDLVTKALQLYCTVHAEAGD
jgi:hypothetical protein